MEGTKTAQQNLHLSHDNLRSFPSCTQEHASCTSTARHTAPQVFKRQESGKLKRNDCLGGILSTHLLVKSEVRCFFPTNAMKFEFVVVCCSVSGKWKEERVVHHLPHLTLGRVRSDAGVLRSFLFFFLFFRFFVPQWRRPVKIGGHR